MTTSKVSGFLQSSHLVWLLPAFSVAGSSLGQAITAKLQAHSANHQLSVVHGEINASSGFRGSITFLVAAVLGLGIGEGQLIVTDEPSRPT